MIGQTEWHHWSLDLKNIDLGSQIITTKCFSSKVMVTNVCQNIVFAYVSGKNCTRYYFKLYLKAFTQATVRWKLAMSWQVETKIWDKMWFCIGFHNFININQDTKVIMLDALVKQLWPNIFLQNGRQCNAFAYISHPNCSRHFIISAKALTQANMWWQLATFCYLWPMGFKAWKWNFWRWSNNYRGRLQMTICAPLAKVKFSDVRPIFSI